MNRRDFIKTTAGGIIIAALPIEIIPSYHGECQVYTKYCMGKDSRPMSNEYGSRPPILCEYHAAIVYKLNTMTLQQLEYVAKRSKIFSNNLLRTVMVKNGERIRNIENDGMRKIRLTAMRVSNEYWKKNYKTIFGV